MNTAIELESLRVPDLSQRRIVVLGGTGGVGEGVVRSWLAAGAEVIVPSRSAGRAARFTEAVPALADAPRLHFVIGNYTTFEGAEATADRITQTYGPVTDVVASIGGWWQRAPLWQVSEADWQSFFVGLITAHVAQVRAWIPRLGSLGSYQLVLGGSTTTPVPGASIINMEQAGLLMMRRVLAAEVGAERRVTSVVLGPVITRHRNTVDPDWVSADEVGMVTVGVGASESVRDIDLQLRSKADIASALGALGMLAASDADDGERA